jgi:hypothetical protein
MIEFGTPCSCGMKENLPGNGLEDGAPHSGLNYRTESPQRITTEVFQSFPDGAELYIV